MWASHDHISVLTNFTYNDLANVTSCSYRLQWAYQYLMVMWASHDHISVLTNFTYNDLANVTSCSYRLQWAYQSPGIV